MIKIRRAQRPPSLQKASIDFVRNDYRNDDVKEALLEMQNKKCCYCEKDLSRLSSTEIEVDHYVPKISYKDRDGNIQWYLANAWENLLYACRTCNNRKRSKNPFNERTNQREILDPTYNNIDPEEHIDFVDDDLLPFYKDVTPLGRSTIDKLELADRADLYGTFRILRKILEAKFIDLINAIIDGSNTQIEAEKKEIERAMSAHVPFTCFTRKFVKKRTDQLNTIDLPRLEEKLGNNYNRIIINFPWGYETVL